LGKRAAVRVVVGAGGGILGLFGALAAAAALIVSGAIPEGAMDAAVVVCVVIAAAIFSIGVFAGLKR
jgi:hypothetical protein